MRNDGMARVYIFLICVCLMTSAYFALAPYH